MLRSWLDIPAIACVVLVALAPGCASLGDDDEAARLSAADVSRARAHQSVGANHLREGRIALAIRELRASEELNPGDRWTQLDAGRGVSAEGAQRRRGEASPEGARDRPGLPGGAAHAVGPLHPARALPGGDRRSAGPDRRSHLPAAVDRAHQQGLGAAAAEATRRRRARRSRPRSTTTTATGEPISTSASSTRRKPSASMPSSTSSECSSSRPARSAPPRRTFASRRSTSRSAIASRLSNTWWPQLHSGRAVHGESDRRTT